MKVMKRAGMSRRQRKLARLAAAAAADYVLPGSGKAAKALMGKKPRSKRRRQRNDTRNSYSRQSESIPAAEGDVIHHNPKRHNFPVVEEELIATVAGFATAVPAVSKYYLNPRNPATFPWLSSLALAFELYKFTSLEFIYVPTCGTAEKGTVTMGIDYESQDPALTTEAQLMSVPGSASGPAYRRISCKAIAGGRSLFAKELFLDEDIADNNMKNLGNFYIMVSGTTSTSASNIGRLFVKYRVELSVQQVAEAGALKGRGWYGTWADANTTTADVFGGGSAVSPTISGPSEDYMAWAGSTAGVVFRNPGAYLVIVYLETTNSTSSGGFAKTFTEAPTGAITLTQFGTDVTVTNAVTATGPTWIVRLAKVSVPMATLQLTITTVISDIDLATLTVIPINSSTLLTAERMVDLKEEFQRYIEFKRLCKVKAIDDSKSVSSICEKESECPAEDQDLYRIEKKKPVLEKSPVSNDEQNVKRRPVRQRESDL